MAELVAAVLIIVLISVRIGAVVVCFTKRRYILGIVGVFVPLVALVGMFKYARPSSKWATRYDDEKMAMAMALFPGDPLVKQVSKRKRITDLVPGDRIGNPTGIQYEVTSTPVIEGNHLSYNVVKANGDHGTRRWLAEEASKERLIWNPNAAEDLAAAR